MAEDTQPKVENEAIPADSTETPAPEETTPFLQVKYNKEEVALSKEEAATLAQKGMNYDKVKQAKEELEQKFNNDPSRQYVNTLAEEYGVDPEKVLEKLNADALALIAKKEGKTVAEIKAERALAEKDATIADLSKYKTEIEQKTQASEQLQQETEAFEKAHPGVPITQEMLEMWGRGYDMETAFEKDSYVKELEKKLNIKKTNEENAAASTGRIGNQEDGHIAEITPEVIKDMTPQQLEKHHSKVWSALTSKKEN